MRKRQRTPLVLASERAQCGLACIAMVAGAHGAALTTKELRSRFAVSANGMTLRRIVEIAAAIGLASRAIRCDLQSLEKLKLPAILHWDLNHFVVLDRVSRGRYTIFDPSMGARRLVASEVSEKFTGVCLELAPTAGFGERASPVKPRLVELLGDVRGWRWPVATVLSLSAALQTTALLTPFYLQWTVDHVLVSGDLSLLGVLFVGFGLLLLFQVVLSVARAHSLLAISSQLGEQWIGNVVAHLNRLPLDFFIRRQMGEIVSRIGSVSAIQRTLTGSFLEGMLDGVFALAFLAVMASYNLKLVALSLLATALYALVRIGSYGQFRARAERMLSTTARLQTHLMETIRGMQSVKTMGVEESRTMTTRALISRVTNAEVSATYLGTAVSAVSQAIWGAERIVVIALGAQLAIEGVLSAGMLVAYIAFREQFAQRTSSLIDRISDFRMLGLHRDRVADITDSPPDALLPITQVTPPPNRFDIMLEGVSFSYGWGERNVLENLSLTVPEGTSLALVGRSGSGKTTLAKIALGLLTPSSGSVSIGGVDITRIDRYAFRSIVGAVMQDDQLFAGSLLENISLGDDSIDIDKVVACSRAAAIHDEITRMPMGYQTLVGDMGSTLSGGQRQRVILARALYKSPRILVLDEATSHLDPETERRVSRAIAELKVTRLIIAHRAETAATADQVVDIASLGARTE